MNECDISNLYLPPKKWDGRVEEWYDQVDRISQHVREQIAQEIEEHYEQQVKEGLGVFFSTNEKFCYEEAADIARGGRDDR